MHVHDQFKQGSNFKPCQNLHQTQGIDDRNPGIHVPEIKMYIYELRADKS